MKSRLTNAGSSFRVAIINRTRKLLNYMKPDVHSLIAEKYAVKTLRWEKPINLHITRLTASLHSLWVTLGLRIPLTHRLLRVVVAVKYGKQLQRILEEPKRWSWLLLMPCTLRIVTPRLLFQISWAIGQS